MNIIKLNHVESAKMIKDEDGDLLEIPFEIADYETHVVADKIVWFEGYHSKHDDTRGTKILLDDGRDGHIIYVTETPEQIEQLIKAV